MPGNLASRARRVVADACPRWKRPVTGSRSHRVHIRVPRRAHPCRRMRRLPPLLLAVACLWLAAPAAAAPNVVVIETDDQTVADMAAMPRTRALIGARGATFDNSFVSLSQCCPSRATFLTGRYAHNHGVLGDAPAVRRLRPARRLRDAAGLAAARRLRDRRSSASTSTATATATRSRSRRAGPTSHGLLGRSTVPLLRLHVQRRRPPGAPRDAPADYQTDVHHRALGGHSCAARAGRRAVLPVDDLRRAAHRRARSIPAIPPRCRPPVPGTTPPRPRSSARRCRGRRRSTRPTCPTSRPRSAAARASAAPSVAALTETWRRRQASLLAGRRGRGAASSRALRDAGELERHAAHLHLRQRVHARRAPRAATGKLLPYEPSIRVPLLMRGPGIPRGDAALASWRGTATSRRRSSRRRARARRSRSTAARCSLARDAAARSDRAVLLEGAAAALQPTARPRFTGLRTPRLKYVEHLRGETRALRPARRPRRAATTSPATAAARAAASAALAARLARAARLRGRGACALSARRSAAASSCARARSRARPRAPRSPRRPAAAAPPAASAANTSHSRRLRARPRRRGEVGRRPVARTRRRRGA